MRSCPRRYLWIDPHWRAVLPRRPGASDACSENIKNTPHHLSKPGPTLQGSVFRNKGSQEGVCELGELGAGSNTFLEKAVTESVRNTSESVGWSSERGKAPAQEQVS